MKSMFSVHISSNLYIDFYIYSDVDSVARGINVE